MTLVNIVPHVILHQKTHVPWAVNFFESQKASQHPVVPILVGVAFGFDEVRVGKFDIRLDPALTLLTGSPNP